MTVVFTWDHFWAYFDKVEDKEIKAHLLKESLGEGWIYRQNAREQIKILEAAPDWFVKAIARGLKPQAQSYFGYNYLSDEWIKNLRSIR